MGKTDPGISDAMTELVDFYATVMDYADIKPQKDTIRNKSKTCD